MKNHESKASFVLILAICISVLIYFIYLDICCSEKVSLTLRTFILFAFTVIVFIVQRLEGEKHIKALLEGQEQLIEKAQKQNELMEALMRGRKQKCAKKTRGHKK